MVLPATTDQLPRCPVQGEMEPKTLLLIARTQSLVKHLQSALDASRYVIRWAPNSSQALGFDLHPSLLVLELPASGGTRSVARLKKRFEAPLLALAGKGQPELAQADAHLVRPYQIGELVELIETTLINHSANIICTENMCLDTEQRRLQVNGLVHQLRPLACSILALLMQRSGQVVPRDELFRRVWHTTDGEDSTRALDVHIAYLRRELETDPRKPRLIVTERGVGYRLRPPD
jgi:two-component system KDP operon response regulator KdpE